MNRNLEFGIKLKFDGKDLEGGIVFSREHFRQFAADAKRAGEAASGGFTSAAQGVRSVSAQLDQAKNALIGYFSATQAASGARWIVEQSAAFDQLNARIKVASFSAIDYAQAQGGAIAIANRWGASIAEVAGSYARLNPVIANLGGGASTTLKMIEGLSASLRLSGATAGETNAVLLQFAQAMGSGRVGGDEFRSMMESAEPMMRAVAEQLGKTTGELRQMAEDGKLTSAVFGNALLPAIDKLKAQAASIPLSVSQAMQVVQNTMSKAFADEFEGAGQSAAGVLASVSERAVDMAAAVHAGADALLFLGKAGGVVAAGAAGAWIARTGQAAAESVAAFVAARAARIAEAEAAAVSASASVAATTATLGEARAKAAAAAEIALYGAQRAAIERELSAAALAHVAASDALVGAETRLAAARSMGNAAATAGAGAAAAASTALTALGGPIGLVTAALTAGAAAWAIWGGASDNALAAAEKRLADLNKQQKFGANPLIANLREEVADYERQLAALDSGGLDAVGHGGDAFLGARALALQEEVDKRVAAINKLVAAEKAAAAPPASAPDVRLSSGGQWGALTKELKWREKLLEEHGAAMDALAASNADRYAAAALKGAPLATLEKIASENGAALAALKTRQQKEISALSKDAVADEKRAATEAAQATKEGWANRLNAIKSGTTHELALLEQAHAAGVADEEAYRADVYRATVAGLGRQAAALQAQLDQTTDKSDAAKLTGDLAEVQAAALKAADGYALAMAKMGKARTDFFEAARVEQGRHATEEADALLKNAKAAEEENARIGLSARQLAELTARRYDEQIALKQSALDLVRSDANRQGEAYAIEQQIAALQRLKSAEVARPALQAQAAAWDKFTDDIERSLTDALMRGFEAGNSFTENFVETLKNTLKSAALKVAVQAVVDPVMGGVRSLAGAGMSSVGSGASAMDLLGIGSSAAQLGGTGSGLYGAFATSAIGESLGLSVSGMAGTSTLTGLGAGLGAALPWVGGALALYSLLNNGGGEDPHNNADQSGVSLTIGTSGRLGNANSDNYGFTGTPASWVAGQTSGKGRWADWSALDSTTLGQIEAQRNAIVTLAREAAASLKLDAGLIRNAAASGNFATIDDALASFGDNVSLRLLPALGQFREGSEKLVTTLSRVVGATRTFDKWADGLELQLSAQGRTRTAQNRNAIYDKASLIRLLGGAAAADTALTGYASAAYSESELQEMQLAQANALLSDTFARLKRAVPGTREELREIVKSFDLATVKGQAAFKSVVDVSAAFDLVQDAAETATQAAIDQARATADSAAEIYDAMRTTAAQMDSVAALAAGLGEARSRILGVDTTNERIAALRARLAEASDLQQQIDLAGQIKDLVLSRYESERSAIEQSRDAWRAAAADVAGFAAGMRLSDLSPLTSKERLDVAASQYFARSSSAHGGDIAAMQGMSSVAEAYLREGRSHWATSPEFVGIFNTIEQDMASLGIAADTTDTWQDQLLTVQTRATDEIDNLVGVTEIMGTTLENALLVQAQEFAALRVPLDKMAGNTRDLDARIAAAVAAVLTRVTLKVTDSGALELARQNVFTTRSAQQVPS